VDDSVVQGSFTPYIADSAILLPSIFCERELSTAFVAKDIVVSYIENCFGHGSGV
jgi:hypothetical protein